MAGRVRDVRIVYDKISRRSKGVAYVEFYEEEAVPLGVALSGKKLLGIPIIIELTETEKNRIAEEAALALRMEKLTQKQPVCKLLITNLNPSINDMDLKRVFQPFGDIHAIQISREDATRSAAVIQYREVADAKQAAEKMNGFELAGRNMRLVLKEFAPGSEGGAAGSLAAASITGADFDDGDAFDADGNGGSRADLMLKLARENSVSRGTARPSPCVVLQHMYDPAAETSPDWEVEIGEEVREECSKFGGVEHLHVQKTADGAVSVRFASAEAAQAAVAALNGRWFGGSQIAATFVPFDDYVARYPRASQRQ